MYCKKCGKWIDDDSEFCRYCGASIAENSKTNENRKTVYDGAVHKCPNCGQVLNSFTAFCPSCGYEIREAKDNSINVFIANLRTYYSLEEKKNYIETFNVPNTNQDLLEFSDYILTSIKPDSGLNDSFLLLMERILKKAKLLYAKVPSRYHDFEEKYKEAKSKRDIANTITKRNEKNFRSRQRQLRINAAIKSHWQKLFKGIAKHPLITFSVLMISASAILITLGSLYLDTWWWFIMIGVSGLSINLAISFIVYKHTLLAFLTILTLATSILIAVGILYSELWYLVAIGAALFILGDTVFIIVGLFKGILLLIHRS